MSLASKPLTHIKIVEFAHRPTILIDYSAQRSVCQVYYHMFSVSFSVPVIPAQRSELRRRNTEKLRFFTMGEETFFDNVGSRFEGILVLGWIDLSVVEFDHAEKGNIVTKMFRVIPAGSCIRITQISFEFGVDIDVDSKLVPQKTICLFCNKHSHKNTVALFAIALNSIGFFQRILIFFPTKRRPKLKLEQLF